MSATPEAKRRALNAVTPNTMRLHTGYPGITGAANEVSGGAPAYAPVAVTYSVSASGEPRVLNASAVFDVPACTVRWVTLWDNTSMLFLSPNGGAPREYSVDVSANTVMVPAHGYADNDPIVFYSSTPPTPLAAGTIYYVKAATADTFEVAQTAGGTTVNLTSAGDADCLVSKITETVYAAQDTHTITAYPFGASF